MKVRMVPIESVVNRFPRMIRDLSKKLGKEMELIMTGEDTELDRTVIDEIGDPLMHMLRNSADHGLEPTIDRLKLGKPQVGTIQLNAYQDGNNVTIEVIDDGAGIDVEKVKETALKKGTITEEQAEMMTEKEAIDLLIRPAFSTSEKITDVSGRGVGLDVVKNKIRIKAYIGKEDVVSVPEKIEGKTVNEIRTGAFKNCNVKKITIPASVETIGSMAFFNLPDCEEITIGNKMALKSDDIFKRCPKIKEVNTKGKGTIVWFIGNSLIEDGNLDTYFQDICDQKKEPVIHYTNTGSGYMVMDHLNDFQKDLPETAYLTADVILIQPLHDYEAMMVSTLSDKCRKDAKIYSLGTIYTRYRNYCKFKNDFSKPLAGFTPGGDLCDDLVQRKILKHYDIQSMDEVHPTYLNGFISGASIYKELFHGKVLDIDYKKMSYALDSFIPGKTDKELEEKMKEILDAAQKFDVKEYQKSGRGYYGYSEKIKRGA